MKTNLPLEQCIGITETADASFHIKEWEDNLKNMAAGIVITKCPTSAFRQAVLRNKDKIIVHITVTGYAQTAVEPNTPFVEDVFESIKNIIEKGFNPNQVVIRIDPVIPTKKGIQKVFNVIEQLDKMNEEIKSQGYQPVQRIRYSFIDMYKHAIDRFEEAGLKNPYGKDKFAPPQEMVDDFMSSVLDLRKRYLFESCAENNMDKRACVSQRDIDLLGLKDRVMLQGAASQRNTCSCPANKVQLISFKTEKCPIGCLYCYWK